MQEAIQATEAVNAIEVDDTKLAHVENMIKELNHSLDVRESLLDALCSDALFERYGLSVVGVGALEEEMLDDPRGDRIDALMCAVQAAWAWQRRHHGFGLPADADTVEGCIADPAMATPA